MRLDLTGAVLDRTGVRACPAVRIGPATTHHTHGDAGLADDRCVVADTGPADIEDSVGRSCREGERGGAGADAVGAAARAPSQAAMNRTRIGPGLSVRDESAARRSTRPMVRANRNMFASSRDGRDRESTLSCRTGRVSRSDRHATRQNGWPIGRASLAATDTVNAFLVPTVRNADSFWRFFFERLNKERRQWCESRVACQRPRSRSALQSSGAPFASAA